MAVLGAAAGGAFPQLFLAHSQTWVPPQDGNVCIHVIGAGGGGAGRGGGAASCYGGGGGGYCRKNSLAVTTSDSFTVVIGGGGTGGLGVGQGNGGGASYVSKTGMTSLYTNGGGRARWNYGSDPGGTASGGDVNNQGGSNAGNVGVNGTGIGGNQFNNYSYGSDVQGGGLACSGFGFIVGGSPAGFQYTSNGSYDEVGSPSGPDLQGGDLCGGGHHSGWSSGGKICAGNGGVGGGGGGAFNNANSGNGVGGSGGDGLVIIQYLPW